MASFIIIILGYPLFKIWPLGQNDGVAGNRMMEKIAGTGVKKDQGDHSSFRVKQEQGGGFKVCGLGTKR